MCKSTRSTGSSRFIPLIFLLGASLMLQGQTADSVLHSYLGAKKEAERKGTEILLWFGAEWCNSCTSIKKDWLNDRSWMGDAASAYSQAWIDVDDFDGFVLKERYAVEQLPSVILLNVKGEILNRKRSAWNKAAFNNWLKQNRLNADPEGSNTKSVVAPSSPSSDEKNHSGESQKSLKSWYSVQVGVYSTRDRAKRRADEIERKTGVPITVEEVHDEEQRIYKLYSKKYEEKSRAHRAMATLNSYGIDGFVRTLSGTKNI